uniref:Uncharacterized protein n=1 Tax=viral metagenome TaxID=1070528 RepID=A0A6C0DCW8_9ZZZZ
MTLYFGLPLTYMETIRILGLNYDSIIKEIKKSYTGNYFEPYIVEYINRYLSNIQLHSTDKGQYILGYEIQDVSVFNKKFMNVDEFMIKIINLRTEFAKEMSKLNADLRQVTLEHLEDEQEVVNNPIPYIIGWDK